MAAYLRTEVKVRTVEMLYVGLLSAVALGIAWAASYLVYRLYRG